jgi:predicted membrane channel-forming protein YqfA (hemolysin III family)
MYVYLAVIILLVFALWKERQALGCPEGLTLADCNNSEGKAVRGTRSSPLDPTPVVVEKIKEASNFADRWVMWRIGFLLSFPCVILGYFFLHHDVPDERTLVVCMFVITALVYFTFNFYKFHLINYAKKNIDEGVDILQSRIP